MLRRDTRVAVMMSGGVDSSVAAALLKQKGFDVIGVTMHLWDYETTVRTPEGRRGCCDISDQHDARVVCGQLGIPHVVLDLRRQFLQDVVQPFEQSYLAGETPNPCVNCNSKIKWGILLGKAGALECEYIATGHYAKIVRGKRGLRLEKSLDSKKDQSYALWEIPRATLARTLLPLGGWTKARIRQKAAELGLRTAVKPESQDVCFIPDHYRKHLIETRNGRANKLKDGKIVDLDENVIGSHDGYFGFTIGQRKGLNISDGSGPYFVLKIMPATNTIVVGRSEDLRSYRCEVRSVNWLSFDPPLIPQSCVVKIRYSDPGSRAMIYPEVNGKVVIEFCSRVRAITPGQSAVWYRGKAVWGGGIIHGNLVAYVT